MSFWESIPLIGPALGNSWGPALEQINRILQNTPLLNPLVSAPLMLVLALLLFWQLIRLRRQRRELARLIAARQGLTTPGTEDAEPSPEVATAEIEAEGAAADEEAEALSETEPEAAEDETVEASPEEAEAVEAPEEAAPVLEEAPKLSLFQRLKAGLAKTSAGLVGKIDRILAGRGKIDAELYDQLEEALVTADVGVQTAMKLLEGTKALVRERGLGDPAQLRGLLKEQVLDIMKNSSAPLVAGDSKPFVIMVVGVNGVGKTTTIGKIASKFTGEGKTVIMAAGDTFRAAAIEQLEIWSQRAGCEIIKQKSGADPSAVAYDAVQAAKSRGVDVVLINTAGRLHTKSNLMEELKKTKRVLAKIDSAAPHETLLILDATTGQNAINQAQVFNKAIELSGLILTKLDGTSKGGCIVGICDELRLPIRFIGIGEKLDDLRPFDPREFVDAMFDEEA